jgi:hypothetical protein
MNEEDDGSDLMDEDSSDEHENAMDHHKLEEIKEEIENKDEVTDN